MCVYMCACMYVCTHIYTCHVTVRLFPCRCLRFLVVLGRIFRAVKLGLHMHNTRVEVTA